MNQDAFPFFDWVHNALYFIFNLLVDAFNIFFLFLARICELLVAIAGGGATRVFGPALAQLGEWISVFAATHADGLLGFLRNLVGFLWSQLADVLGVALLWIDAQLPPTLSLNISGLLIVASYLKSVTYLIDVPFVIATATLGIGMAWTIQLVKVIVRLTPFIG